MSPSIHHSLTINLAIIRVTPITLAMPMHILSPQSTTLPNITLAFGLLATASGSTALLSPRDGIKNFGLRPVADEAGNRLAEALVQAYGVRNVSMGLINISLWYLGRHTSGPTRVAWRRTLGLLFVANAAIPFVDGIVCKRQGQSSEWAHWIFAPISIVLGGALMLTPGAI